MDIEHWKLFVELTELGSLTKAAASRSTAQSAISRQLAVLERSFGGRLFHRTGRGVTLTQAGARILPRVKAWLKEADEIANEMKATVGVPAGVVRVGIILSAGHPLVTLLFRQTRLRFPEIHLRVLDASSGQLSAWLESGEIDIAILFRYGYEARPEEHPLAVVDTFLVSAANDAFTRSPTVNFSRLDGLPLILPGPPNSLRRVLDQAARKKRITLSVVMECDSLAIQKDIVADGAGYGICGLHSVMQEVQAGRLQASRIVYPRVERTITLCISRHRAPTLACREVARLIRLCAEQISSVASWKYGRAGQSS